MSNEIPSLANLESELASMVQKSFPKKCVCGRNYLNLDDLLTRTGPTNYPSNILSRVGYRDESVVALSRACECGATLLVVINDRRDRSPEGIEARRRFGEILDTLVASGIQADVARDELLNILAGGESRFLTGREMDMVGQIRPPAEKVAAESKVPEPAAESAQQPQKCKGTTKLGHPCRLLALPGSDFCQIHGGKS